MKTKIALFKLNDDDTETRVGNKNFDTDQDAIKAIKEPGQYIFYPVVEVTKEDIAKSKA